MTELYKQPKKMLISVDNENWRKELVFGIFNSNAIIKVKFNENNIDDERYLGYPYYKEIDDINKLLEKYSKEELIKLLEDE